MIKAIIFDCFGVLVRDGWLHFKDEHFGHDPKLWAKAGELNRQSNAGLFSYDDLIRRVSRLAGLDEAVLRKDLNNHPRNNELFSYIKANLKPNYKIGLLSNASENWLDELFLPQQQALFNAVVLSYQVNATKPDPSVYYAIAEQLGVSVEECIFIDDQERHCEGARAVGMQTITYQNNEQFFTELEAILKS